MTNAEERWQELREGWEHFGRAAEHFARRVADDARRFAERVEEHVGQFADDVRRDWRGHGEGGSADDVRRVFEDLRGVLAAVIEGVDDLVTDLFSRPGDENWTRIVCNRDVTCDGCGRPIAAGGEAHVRRAARRREFRCLTCGAPNESSTSV